MVVNLPKEICNLIAEYLAEYQFDDRVEPKLEEEKNNRVFLRVFWNKVCQYENNEYIIKLYYYKVNWYDIMGVFITKPRLSEENLKWFDSMRNSIIKLKVVRKILEELIKV
jgi:hypothetical protein